MLGETILIYRAKYRIMQISMETIAHGKGWERMTCKIRISHGFEWGDLGPDDIKLSEKANGPES